MSVLDVLSRVARGAAGAAEGYSIDSQRQVTTALAQQKATEEAERSRVLNLLTQREISTPRLGDANYGSSLNDAATAQIPGKAAEASAMIPVDVARQNALRPGKVADATAMIAPKVAEQTALEPGKVKEAADTVAATTPITSGAAIKQHEAERSFDNAHTPQTYSPVTTTGEGGEQKVSAFDTKTGTISDTGAQAKAGATGGGAADKRAKSYVDLMTQSLPQMEALSAKVRPEAIAAAIKFPTAGNAVLNQDEQNYIQAARNFMAGVLHQESGARLSAEQLSFGLQRFLPNLGDTPQTVQTKLAAARKTTADRVREYGAGAGAPSATATPDHSQMTDAEFAAAWKAGKFRTP